MKTKRKNQPILGYCALCRKVIYSGTSFDLNNIGGKMKAVCKGGCDAE